MAKLNLLMLNYEFPPIGGGGANANLQLLKQFANNDQLKVDLLTSAPKPGLNIENFAENVTIYKVGINKKDLHHWKKSEVILWLMKARLQYKKMTTQNNYDLVHAFFGFPTGFLCLKTAKKLPYIISLRGSDVPGKNARLKLDYKILGPLFKKIWKNATAIVACSQGLKNRALKFLPTVAIDVIANGINLEKFHPQHEKKPSKTLKLITVGRLSPTKRVDMLIDATEILHDQELNIHLAIAGGGPLEKSLKQIVKQKNLTSVIEITGRLDPEVMPHLYRQSDIFVSATLQEGMSNAMLEAAASALPIVTTPCEGLDELIKNNGIIVQNSNAQAIADAIKKLADDNDLYNQMSADSRKLAENFSWQNAANQYLNLYNKLIAGGI
ncbi:MAG: glycosyltransferase family 4 protein [Planctomycetes bacterium]|nr:glycosyltransferase family 4 protein [Planctomycetota bacterium]